jgi:hypothetical protein
MEPTALTQHWHDARASVLIHIPAVEYLNMATVNLSYELLIPRTAVSAGALPADTQARFQAKLAQRGLTVAAVQVKHTTEENGEMVAKLFMSFCGGA